MRGYGRFLAKWRFFFCPGLLGVTESLPQQESVGGDAQARMVMESSPASALVVAQPQVLLEFLIVALDAPAHLRFVHHALERHGLGQRREPVTCPAFFKPFIPGKWLRVDEGAGFDAAA